MEKLFQIHNFIYRLFLSRFSFSQKCKILFVYIRLILRKLFSIKNRYVKLFWFKIEWRSLSHIIWLFWEIFLKNEYFFESSIHNPIIIDWWSNIWMNIFYRRCFYPNSIIYCFEPDIINFKILKNNIKNNSLKNVFLYNQAIGEDNWTIDFFYKEDNLTTSSIFNKRGWNKKININVIKLSDFIKDKDIKIINMLKLDIEWAEDQCIKDLYVNGSLVKFISMTIEYHNNIDGKKDRLWDFLNILELNWFFYYFEVENLKKINKKTNQDFMIYVKQND